MLTYLIELKTLDLADRYIGYTEPLREITAVSIAQPEHVRKANTHENQQYNELTRVRYIYCIY